jgi:very-short-patch-repair endonuclease
MTDRARTLRSGMTDAERKLWLTLRGDQTGVRFRRQLVIGKRYIADFCAPEIGLIIEVDGGQHVDSATEAERTSFLESCGYTVLRFWNNDVLASTDSVAEAIHCRVVRALAARTSPPTPLRNGEGRSMSPKDTD